MKNNLLPFVCLMAIAAGCSTVPSSDMAEAPAEPVAAVPVFGAGLSLPDITLSPHLALPGWSFRGSSGGLEPDADGWRPFQMRAGSAPDLLRGKARFTPGGNAQPPAMQNAGAQPPPSASEGARPPATQNTGAQPPPSASEGARPLAAHVSGAKNGGLPAAPAIRAEWRVTPDADTNLLELFVGGDFPGAVIAGGQALVDGRPVALPLDGANPHIFRGAITNLALLDRDGVEHLRVAFDRPTGVLLQDAMFWGGYRLTLRFFFAEGPVKGGREYGIDATVATPAAGPLALAAGEPVTLEAGPDWIPLAFDPWIEPGSALDFSSVLPHHAPAGKFGRLNAVGDHFEFEGLPGVPQRFYGVNLCGTANLPSSREAADRFVSNLARIGYNAIRVHHHERTLIAEDGRPHPDLGDAAPTPAQWEKFDNLVAACVENGVYLTTDLFVSRSHVTSWRSIGIDQDGYLSDTAHFKILCAFWEPAYSNLCTWTKNFLCHVNPRTGRSLAEEPALVTLALINEGNLGNWGGGFLRDLPGVSDAWRAWLARQRNDAASRGTGAPASAWDGIPDAIPDDLYAVGDTPAGRHAGAFAMFLADCETALFERLKTFVREECGCKTPLSSLSSWYNPVQYQLPRTHFDYVDDHFYVDHPKFLDRSWSLPSSCPNVNPIAGSSTGARSVEWRRLMDKPFCLTEWNYSCPGRFRGVGGIATGALGALQGWDGMWRFAWSHGRAGIETPGGQMGYFDMNADPLGLAAERAALCLFLRRDLPELDAEYPLVLDEAALRDPRTGAPAGENSAINWAGWHARVGSTVLPPEARETRLPALHASLRTTTGQARADLDALDAARAARGAVSIDPATGTFLLDTPRTAGGFAESGAHAAGPLRFELHDAPATVWASSLDGRPIPSSSRILVTHLTDVQNSGIRYGDPSLTILLAWGSKPHLARRGSADIALSFSPDAAGGARFAVYRLDTAGRRIAPVPATCRRGRLAFTARTDLDPAAATMLYELVRE